MIIVLIYKFILITDNKLLNYIKNAYIIKGFNEKSSNT